MKARLCLLTLLACLLFTVTVPASAQILYENGAINGTTDAWTINFGFIVSDTFTISGGTSTVTGVSFGAWIYPGDTLQSAEVSFTSEEFGGHTYFDQVVAFTASNCSANQYGYDVCVETGNFTAPGLANGTYWMNLGNAVTAEGNPVYWDENNGVGCHSQGCPSEPSQNSLGTILSEAFSILGTTSGTGSTVPEPGSLLLVGSGFASLGFLRRKLR